MANTSEIKNRKATHEYFLEEKLTAGIVLSGSEIKSIREGKASLKEAYCYIRNSELFIKMKPLS
jgi:SsrA-binding protein